MPLLALLSLAGLLWRRRAAGISWVVAGTAAMLLLAPALALPDGVASPDGDLAEHPPFQAAGPRWSGNPQLVDVSYQIEPWLIHLRRELRALRWPFWNPHQFSGAPFWGNGQSAPLWPPNWLVAVLPIEVGLLLLPWLRLTLAATGAAALARELGLSAVAAQLAGLSFGLCGMVASYALFPMGNALALVPWVLWAVERTLAVPGRWWQLALVVSVQAVAGHPETVLHTGLLALLWLVVRGGAAGWWRRGAALAGGWLAGAALAGAALMPMAANILASARWQNPAAREFPSLATLAPLPLRLLLPQLYGQPAEGTWWGPYNYLATAVYCGALVIPLAIAGLGAARNDRRWRAVVVLLVVSFAVAYQLPVARELVAALPLVGRALHHRLLFGVALMLALLAGAGVDRWRGGGGRPLRAAALLVAALLALAWWRFGAAWSARGLEAGQAAWTALALGVALLLAASLWLAGPARRRLALWLPVLALCDLVAAHGRLNPALPLGRLFPETGAVSFLRHQEGRVAGLGQALRPNAATVFGLFDVRGDDTLKLARYEAVYAQLAPSDPAYFTPIARWDDTWLDRLGVRWVLGGPAQEPPQPDWRIAYAGADARVWERPTAQPLVRWTSGTADPPRVQARAPGFWRIAASRAAGGRLEIAETWAPGWSARIGGRSAPVSEVNGLLLGVEVPAGGGEVELRYRPPGLAAGLGLSLAGAAAIAAGCRGARRGARREDVAAVVAGRDDAAGA